MGRRESRRRKLAAAMAVAGCLAFGGMQSVWADTAEKSTADGNNQDVYSLGEVTVEAKRPDWESKLSPGTVTVIRPADYKGEQKDLADFLKMVPGVHVREVNGKGQYTTVSIRGSTAAQVGVFVDGVLCNLGGDAAVDISTIPVHNVERIEIYRGYVPARFGGTYMGGVINIVTKRPTKANVDASVGHGSYGGYKAGLEVDAPLGDGSLMFGLNRDQSQGDFRYTNTYSKAYAADYEKYNYNNVHAADNLTCAQAIATRVNRFINILTTLGNGYVSAQDIQAMIRDPSKLEELHKIMQEHAGKEYTEEYYQEFIAQRFTNIKIAMETYKKYLNDQRWRKSNDYKNTDAILKWQDDHWLTKFTWKRISRHIPEPIDNNYGEPAGIDLVEDPIYDHRKQVLTDTEFLVGRRQTVGNLEWGWKADYLKQEKEYHVDNWEWIEKNSGSTVNAWSPCYLWSRYDTKKWMGQIDGSYKAGNRNLIEFLVNASKETMHIHGWKMFSNDFHSSDTRNRYRNFYEQDVFNAQMQDTITLDKKGSLWLTPSVRYNQSTITGRSTWYDKKKDPQNWKFFNQTDKQKDGKGTWQIALKKQVNDNLVLRTTGGTYYRLLNMYEIAGDGAGIIPMPNIGKNGLGSVFPRPEYGTQWDFSVLWDKPILGTQKTHIEATYFGRNSKRMLQLSSWNHFFFVYTNAASARINGMELQMNLSWEKWDGDIEGTYIQPSHVKYDLTKLPGWYSGTGGIWPGYLTYTPKWEGTARMTYRPGLQWALFGQLHYTGGMRTSLYGKGDAQKQTSLTTLDLGIKYKPKKNMQFTVGVNDLFDRADSVRLYDPEDSSVVSQNIQYPIQGRTWYATIQYDF